MLFVAPGLLFDLLSRRRRVDVDESAFREASRVVLGSVALGVPGAASAFLVWVAATGAPPVLGKIVSGDTTYFREYSEIVFWSICAYVTGSALAAWGTNDVLGRVSGRNLTPTQSQWTKVFRHERPKGSWTYVRLLTTSGKWWGGPVLHYTADLEVGGRELTLSAPVSRGNEDGTGWSTVNDIQRLIIRGDEVETVLVMYVPAPEPAAPKETPTPVISD